MQHYVYFGTYTGPKSKGIYVARIDDADGKVSEPELAAETPQPSFVALHPNGKLLYAVGETENFGGRKTGTVSGFKIDASNGKLTLINQQPSGGAAPCHLTVDKTGRALLVANYSAGTVSAFPIETAGDLKDAMIVIQHKGSSIDPKRQEGAHAHSINVDANNRFAIAADLGLDKLFVYRLDPAKALLTANDPPYATVKPGSGPRHFAFHRDGRHAYVINEMACTVIAFNYDSDRGELKEIQTLSSLPPGQSVESNFSTAEVQVHPSGKFVYGSNRGHNSIVAYRVDAGSGKLTYLDNTSTQGKTPRNFGIHPYGKFLLAANQDSDTVTVFRINPENGRLEPTGQIVNVPKPVCVKFLKI